MNRPRQLTLLLLLWLAPACAPDQPPPPPAAAQNLVLLTDTTRWAATTLRQYKDSLTTAGYRVLVSGYPGETTTALLARLPWLLQPGVDKFIYDDRLAGSKAGDSLRLFLEQRGHPAPVVRLIRE